MLAYMWMKIVVVVIVAWSIKHNYDVIWKQNKNVIDFLVVHKFCVFVRYEKSAINTMGQEEPSYGYG